MRLPRPGIRILAAITTVLGVCTVATAGLVLEDVLPSGVPTGMHVDLTGSTTPRVIFLAVSTVALVVATWMLAGVKNTLHYVRLLDHSQPDRHAQSAFADAINRERFRLLTRRYLVAEQGIVDLRDQLAALNRELERLINEDGHRSRPVLAPNLPMPAALSLGFGWAAASHASIREFNSHQHRREVEFKLHQVRRAHQRLQAGHRPKVGNLEFTVFGRPEAAGPRWLEFRLTLAERQLPVAELDLGPGLPTVSSHHILGRSAAGHVSQFDDVSLNNGSQAAEVAALVASTIWNFHLERPDSVLILSGSLTKSVAVAAGWLLHDLMLERQGTRAEEHLWRRIVVLYDYPGLSEPRRILWLRHDQTDPLALLESFGRDE